MSIASAPGSLSAFSPELLTRFLESLRRDAFVLEAYNYESPAIADNEDFQLALWPLGEQVRALFGNDTMVLAAVDANGCKERETGNLSRQVLVGLVHPKIDVRVWPKRSVQSSDAVPKLADCIINGGRLRDFWSKADADVNQFFETNVNPKPDDQVIIAPYLVHRTDADALSAKEGKFRQLVDLWQRQRDNPDLIYTQPFVGSPGNRLALFGDAYYAAVLVVYVEPGIQLTQAHMNWLEAFHISFQTAWGFPALEETKKAFEAKRQEAEDMRKQVRSFQTLQILAHKTSVTIHEQMNVMRRRLDPGVGLEREELARLFTPRSNEELWTGAGITITPEHDFKSEPAATAMNCEAIKYYAVHRIFDTIPSSDFTFQELRLNAEALVRNNAQHSKILVLFLTAVVTEGSPGFDLLKEVCRLHMSDDFLPFYALATMFFLAQVAPDFTVHIQGDGPDGQRQSLSANDFLELKTRASLLLQPRFHKKKGKKPSEWALPLVDLVARELQAEQDKVSVSSVTMIAATPCCEIICHLKGSSDAIGRVLDLMNKKATQDGSQHGLRTALLRLQEAKAALGSQYFSWVTDAEKKQVSFKIRA